MTVSERKVLVDRACEEAGLNDFGDEWFFKNLDALIPAINAEAKLNEEGVFGAEAMLTGALMSRLQHVALLKAHPEILDEEVNVAAVIVGLPRTGSTMLHRMMSSAPGMTAVRWYEAQNYVPFAGEQRGEPQPRKEAAQHILNYMLEKIPELMSIHPMSIDQADEEVIILGKLFSSTMMEASFFVPSYARWLMQQSSLPAYQDLYQVLQSLQWQNPERKGKRWVLKTPGHLMALDAVLSTFSDAKIIMTHRDPAATVPSYCSMQRSLYGMGSNEISNTMIGDYWPARLQELMQSFMQVRADGANNERFIDVYYQDLLHDPVAEGKRLLDLVGALEPSSVDAMQAWQDGNKRGARKAHAYSQEEFGLQEVQLAEMFAAYNQTYF